MRVNPQGSPDAPVWIVVERPYAKDEAKGYLFSSGYGYVLQKMLADAGIRNFYITSRLRDLEHPDTYSLPEIEINFYKPPIIMPLGPTVHYFCDTTRPKKGDKTDKYWGSILTSKKIQHPHYIIPTAMPDEIVKDWSLRDIAVFLDFGKAKSELDYIKQHNCLEPLPQYNLQYDFEEDTKDGFERLCAILEGYRNSGILSADIETVYPRAKSAFKYHPGYPITLGLAPSATEGISFKIFRDDPRETAHLWRVLDSLFDSDITFLGQNYFNFDAPRLEMLGWTINYERIADTLVRHHILWPELSHKLQFQTKQYTRQPYYKDEGHGWSLKDLLKLKRYNCLDCCVTYKIYEEQEREFNARPDLR
jgi:uracil-DNA glycosylase